MRKKDKFSKVLWVLSIISLIIATLEGFFYYASYAEYPIFRIMLTLQNSIKAFGFRADISLQSLIGSIQSETFSIKTIIDYAYGVTVFVAPICTVSALYKVFDALLKWNVKFRKKKASQNIIIFGYNENVRTLISKEDEENNKKRKVRIITPKALPANDERQIWNKKAIWIEFDCLDASEKELDKFCSDIELEKADTIILFDDSTAKNFSLFCMLRKREDKLSDKVKVYCACEENGTHRIIESCFDESSKIDLEVFSIAEMQIRKIYKEHPLHTYYLNEETKRPLKEWNTHLLIVGFGTIGQQMLLQAMNQSVIHSQNNVLIDVVDCKVEEKKSIFENHFSAKYVEIGKDEIVIANNQADGELRIRFRQMDIRYKQFEKMLSDLSEDNPFTYVAICMKDTDVNLHCLLELEKYFDELGQDNISIGIRMDFDAQMSEYLSSNKTTHKNVFVIQNSRDVIALDDLVAEKLNQDAKKFNYIYSQLNILSKVDCNKAKKGQDHKVPNEDECWKSLKLFQRNANRALSSHTAIKQEAIAAFGGEKELLDKHFGDNGIVQKKGDDWVFNSTEQELLESINGDAFLREMAMLEHRRWCYYMASQGWRYTIGKKNEQLKANPCMINWDGLCKTNVEMCKYDLLPLLLRYEEIHQEKKAAN